MLLLLEATGHCQAGRLPTYVSVILPTSLGLDDEARTVWQVHPVQRFDRSIHRSRFKEVDEADALASAIILVYHGPHALWGYGTEGGKDLVQVQVVGVGRQVGNVERVHVVYVAARLAPRQSLLMHEVVMNGPDASAAGAPLAPALAALATAVVALAATIVPPVAAMVALAVALTVAVLTASVSTVIAGPMAAVITSSATPVISAIVAVVALPVVAAPVVTALIVAAPVAVPVVAVIAALVASVVGAPALAIVPTSVAVVAAPVAAVIASPALALTEAPAAPVVVGKGSHSAVAAAFSCISYVPILPVGRRPDVGLAPASLPVALLCCFAFWRFSILDPDGVLQTFGNVAVQVLHDPGRLLNGREADQCSTRPLSGGQARQHPALGDDAVRIKDLVQHLVIKIGR
mmetsp:Transcript_30470/g.69282  ORF Transcript_30470/g.69282 Transcript_30470/m.69282 type:complete len:405 (-) Transcript_30470:270-1484(-)